MGAGATTGGYCPFSHLCPQHRVREQGDKMIAEMPDVFLRDAAVTEHDLDVGDKAWHQITKEKELLSRFFDAFFRIMAEFGDSSISDAHGTGLKTRSKFIVDVFSDSLKMLRAGSPQAINKIVETNCRRYLVEMGLRVPQYLIVGQVMMRCFEECDNPYWGEEPRLAWRRITSVICKLLIRAGLKVEAELTPEELASIGSKVLHADDRKAAEDESNKLGESRRNSNSTTSKHDSTDSESSAGRGSTDEPLPTCPVPDPTSVVYDDACWEG
jgi:hemoglobin-like flavoprotein